MKKYKIVKEIHKYSTQKTVFRVYSKFLWKWIPCSDFVEFNSIEDAEESIFDKFKYSLGGIIEVDNNVYTFVPYSTQF